MSVAPIVIDVLVKGMPQVQQSFKGVQDAATRAERAMQREAERTEKARIAMRERSATMAGRLAAKQAADEKRAADKVARDAEKAEREKQRIRDRSATMAGKLAAKQAADEKRANDISVREADRAAKARERIIEREARQKVRFENQAAREVERIGERARRAAKRDYDRSEREKDRDAKRWVKEREREIANDRKERARVATGIVGGAFQGVAAGVQRTGSIAMGLATTASQLGGGFSIADSVAQRGELERNAILLGNSALGIGGVTKADVDPAKIIARAKAASIATGTDAGELVAATQSYVAKSSDFKGGMENMEFFGDLAKGTGAKLSDIADAAGIIRSQNKNLDAEGVKNMLLAVVKQGQQGSVELSDLAKSAGKMTRSATSYAGDQTVNQQKLLGLSQIAVRTTGSPEGAAVALSALGSDTRGNADKISAALGYSVLDKGGKVVNSPEELIANVMGATGGNLAKLGQKGGLGFTKPTMKIFEALKPEFDRAQEEWLAEHKGDTKGANAAGAKAALAEMTEITGQTMTRSEMGDMAARVRGSSSEKLEAAMRELKMSVGDELLPEFIKLVPVIRQSTPAFVDLLRTGVRAFVELIKTVADFAKAHEGMIHSLAAHPIATLIGFEISKSFASAALPALLQRLMTAAFAGSGGAANGGGLLSGAAKLLPAGMGGAVAAGAAAGIATGAVIYNAGTKYADGAMAADDMAAKVDAYARGDRSERAMSPAAAYQAIQDAKSRLVKDGGALNQAGNILASPFSDDASKSYAQYKSDQALVDSAALRKAIEEAAAAGVREGVRAGLATTSGANGSARGTTILER